MRRLNTVCLQTGIAPMNSRKWVLFNVFIRTTPNSRPVAFAADIMTLCIEFDILLVLTRSGRKTSAADVWCSKARQRLAKQITIYGGSDHWWMLMFNELNLLDEQTIGRRRGDWDLQMFADSAAAAAAAAVAAWLYHRRVFNHRLVDSHSAARPADHTWRLEIIEIETRRRAG